MWCSPALALAPSDLLSSSTAGAGAAAADDLSSAAFLAARSRSISAADDLARSYSAAASECSIAAARSASSRANASQDGDLLHACCCAIADRPVCCLLVRYHGKK
ncbi:hypothetical protein PVAP13_3KG199527 [Panicum virgatum]|uniref:Uncharacterized protein n=1 Tax=Panicum virgatum TaxID=38727 RepID=A0A8T0US91_PANVG|nr:hypothetical protein PVAP13_3KG199527 [Panicum virgatum]